MNFLIDENFPANSIGYLRPMYRGHSFDHVVDGNYQSGIDDLTLFAEAQKQGVNVLITGDIRQIMGQDRLDEHAACRAAGIHWLGIPQVLRARGKDGKWAQINSLLSNLRYAVKHFESASEPTAILLQPGSFKLQAEKDFPQPL